MSDSTPVNNFGLINLPPIPDSIDNAIENITDQPTQCIGTTLADIWFLVFGGLSQAAEKKRLKYAQDINEFKETLERKTSKIPEDKKIDPDIRIVGPALEGVKYTVGSKELREMFSNLIASSMNSDNSEYVHPSFVEIIKQLSPLEANILKFISDNSYKLPVCRISRRLVKNIDESSPMRIFSPGENFLINDHSGETVLRNYSFIKGNREQLSSCFDNLNRLGILDIDYSSWFTLDEVYNPFLYDQFLLNWVNQPPAKNPLGFLVPSVCKGICRATELGKMFMACVLD